MIVIFYYFQVSWSVYFYSNIASCIKFNAYIHDVYFITMVTCNTDISCFWTIYFAWMARHCMILTLSSCDLKSRYYLPHKIISSMLKSEIWKLLKVVLCDYTGIMYILDIWVSLIFYYFEKCHSHDIDKRVKSM